MLCDGVGVPVPQRELRASCSCQVLSTWGVLESHHCPAQGELQHCLPLRARTHRLTADTQAEGRHLRARFCRHCEWANHLRCPDDDTPILPSGSEIAAIRRVVHAEYLSLWRQHSSILQQWYQDAFLSGVLVLRPACKWNTERNKVSAGIPA